MAEKTNWATAVKSLLKKYKGKRCKKHKVFLHLRDRCEIEEGTTLQDIFNIVQKYPILKSFISQYSWCREIDAFHEQANYCSNEPSNEEISTNPSTNSSQFVKTPL